MTVSNEIEIVVVSRDKTDFPTIQAKAKAAGENIGKELSSSTDKSFKQIEKNAGSSFERVGKDAGHKVSGGLESAAGDIAKSGEKAGLSFGSSLASEAESMLASTGPGGAAIGAAIVGIGIAAAPVLGAALSAATIGGAAGLGIIGGLVLVKDDPRVKGAAAELGQTVMTSLKADAQPFVEPVLKGIGIIKGAFEASNSDIAAIFSKSATFVEPLVQAAADVLPKITSGINALVQNAGPVIDALAQGIGMVGDAIGDGFKKLSTDGPAAAAAIVGAFAVLTETIKATFVMVDSLSKVFGKLAEWGAFGVGIRAAFLAAKDGADQAKSSTDAEADSLSGVSDQAKDAEDALHGVADALKAQTDPAFALIDAQKQLSDAQGKYNDALKTHGRNSEEARSALLAVAKAAIGVEGATENAGDALNGRMTPALKATLRAAGLSEDAIAALGDQFDQSASQGRGFARTYTAKAQLEGVDNVKQLAREAKAFISSIPSVKTTTIRTVYVQIGKPFSTSGGSTGIGGGNYTGHAAGGVVGAAANGGPQSNMTLVGEQGPELVNLAPGSMVTPAGQTQSLLTQSRGAGEVKVSFEFTGNTDTVFATALQKMFNSGLIRINSRNVI